MPVIDRFPSWFPGDSLAPLAQTKNWRLLVFLAVFSRFTASKLIYNYARTAEYRAGARVEIVPAEKLPGEPGRGSIIDFLTERCNSSPRAHPLKRSSTHHAGGICRLAHGSNPCWICRKIISAEPVSGTQVLQLWAVGEKPSCSLSF